MKLIEKQIRIPIELAQKMDKLGAMCGLTGDQMGNAIIVLQFHANGWFNEAAKPKAKSKLQATTPTRAKKPRLS